MDQWKHRGKEMKCLTCMFFVFKEADNKKSRRLGRCRKHAPTTNGYPVVFEADWCGDHKLDENKI